MSRKKKTPPKSLSLYQDRSSLSNTRRTRDDLILRGVETVMPGAKITCILTDTPEISLVLQIKKRFGEHMIVESFRSPVSAFEFLLEHPVSLIISGLARQDEITGMDFLNACKELYFRVPILLYLPGKTPDGVDAAAAADIIAAIGHLQDSGWNTGKYNERLKNRDIDMLMKLANAYRMLRQYEAAGDIYKSVIDVSADNIEAVFGLANCYREMGKYSKSSEAYKKALKLMPSFANAYFGKTGK